MESAYAVWVTPRMLPSIASSAADEHEPGDSLSCLDARLKAYVESACEPLLATEARDEPAVRDALVRIALLTNDLRLRFVMALADVVHAAPKARERLASTLASAGPAVESDLGSLVSENALDCFQIGIRVASRSLVRIIRAGSNTVPNVNKKTFRSWVELWLAASCLDLAATTVIVYAETDRSPNRAPLVEILCRLPDESDDAEDATLVRDRSRGDPGGRGSWTLASCQGQDLSSLSLPEVRVLHLGVVEQLLRVVREDDRPRLHDVAAVGELERHAGVLLDDEDGPSMR